MRILFRSVLLFLIGFVVFWIPNFLSSLCILEIRCGVGKNLFPFDMLPFCPIDDILFLTEAFQFHFLRLRLLIVDLSAFAIGVLSRRLFPGPRHSRLFSTSSSIRFSIFGFLLRSWIHLDLSFMQGDKYGLFHILLHADAQFDQHNCVDDSVFFPVCIFVFSIKTQMHIGV